MKKSNEYYSKEEVERMFIRHMWNMYWSECFFWQVKPDFAGFKNFLREYCKRKLETTDEQIKKYLQDMPGL